MKKETHETRLLAYLKQYRNITSLEAIRDLGNTRLSATVYTLRRKGHDISTTTVDVPTRWGTTTQVARYHLNEAMTNQAKENEESRNFWAQWTSKK